jgi:uncharacterized radical SAM superfamily Fe-S cluster-containing enzyme
MPVRTDRIRRYVVAFCPACHDGRPLAQVRRLSGYLSQSPDGRVWLVRGCPDHGRIVTLYEENAEILDYLEQWTAPTKVCTPDTHGNFEPVPGGYLDGLGEMQNQHTCTLLLDLTDHCNLTCPTCFASSSPQRSWFAPVASVLAALDARLAREGGSLDVVMLSGGEPTLHPDFTAIVEGVLARNIQRLLINTNGTVLARNDRLLDIFARHRDRVEIYLQYDGFRESTHLALRGVDLRTVKEGAVRRLSAAGVFTTLVMTAARGVNVDEIGAVIDLALDTPFVGGASIQPVFGSGRTTGVDPNGRLTHTGVLRDLAAQPGGRITYRDLIALPCSHPHCCSIGYLVRTDAGQWRSLVSLIGHEQLKRHLGLVSNRMTDPTIGDQVDLLAQAAINGLFSSRASHADPTFHRWFDDVRHGCNLSLDSLTALTGLRLGRERARRELGTRVKRITIKPFMDITTLLEERLLQCCVHVGTQDGERYQCIPFCAAQTWSELDASKIGSSPDTTHHRER